MKLVVWERKLHRCGEKWPVEWLFILWLENGLCFLSKFISSIRTFFLWTECAMSVFHMIFIKKWQCTGYSLVGYTLSCGACFPQWEHILIQASGALFQWRHWRQVNMIQILIIALKYSQKLLSLKEMLYIDNTRGI